MQRKDINVGAELYYSSERKFREYGSGMKAVVDAGYWVAEDYRNLQYDRSLPPHREARPRERNKAGVLVDFHYADEVRRGVARSANLHGPYAETLVEVEKFRQERAEGFARTAAARQEAESRVADLVSRFAAIGVLVHDAHTGQHLHLAVGEAEKLLAAYEKVGES